MANASNPVTITYSSTNLMQKLIDYRENEDNKTGLLHHIATRKLLSQIASPILYTIQIVETIAFAVLTFLVSPLAIFNKTQNFYVENFISPLGTRLERANLTLQIIFTNLFRKNVNSQKSGNSKSVTQSLSDKIRKYSTNPNNNRCNRELAQRLGGFANLVSGIIEAALFSIASIVVAPFTPLHGKVAKAHDNIIGMNLANSVLVTNMMPLDVFGKLDTVPPVPPSHSSSPVTATA